MKRKRLGIASAETPFYILLGARGGGQGGGKGATLQRYRNSLRVWTASYFKKSKLKTQRDQRSIYGL